MCLGINRLLTLCKQIIHVICGKNYVSDELHFIRIYCIANPYEIVIDCGINQLFFFF